MKLSEFEYKLPHELIAQEPLKNRSASRLMVLDKNTTEHKTFTDIIDYLKKSDVLVMNNTKVFPARIFGRKQTGGKTKNILLIFLASVNKDKNILDLKR